MVCKFIPAQVEMTCDRCNHSATIDKPSNVQSIQEAVGGQDEFEYVGSTLLCNACLDDFKYTFLGLAKEEPRRVEET